MPRTVEFEIVQGDIAAFDADVIVLKYAQAFHGADKYVVSRLWAEEPQGAERWPAAGQYRLVKTFGHIQAKQALFVGVVRLRDFRYEHVRELAVQALDILSREAPDTKHVAMTIHAAGIGLDEAEAFLSQFIGCVDALQAGRVPASLERLSIVEIVEDRVQRLRRALDKYLAMETDVAAKIPGRQAYTLPVGVPETPTRSIPGAKVAREPRREQPVEPPTSMVVPRGEKPHAFIAMPFRDDMDDVFYYGIQNPVHNSGLLCERVDKSAFTGDIMGYVRQRIETASIVIAELTGANPNVYLEVGYAWGKERPTILLIQSEKELEFDVRGHKCLTYRKIKDLEQALNKEIQAMITAGIIKL